MDNGLGPKRPIRIQIVANYTGDDHSSNNRFNDLARRLAHRGIDVHLVTSDFSHARKMTRRWDFGPKPYRITNLHEMGYQKNVSVTRLFSQWIFAREVARFLRTLDARPDIVLVATPPPAVARACAEYCRRTGSQLVVDIQDLWPEAFGMITRFKRLSRAVFTLMRIDSIIAYSTARLIVAVSRTYIKAAEDLLGGAVDGLCVYLGANLSAFRGRNSEVDMANSVRIVYVGSLSVSYDLRSVIDALTMLKHRPGLGSELQLVVLGDGPLRAEFEDYARSQDISARFLGKLPYQDMANCLSECHIAVNPIRPGSAGSVLNKVGDYAAAGLPVINTQESPEYRQLLERYQAGINCDPGSAEQIVDAVQELIDQPDRREEMGHNSRRMANELFNRDNTYEAYVDTLLALIQAPPSNVQDTRTQDPK